ncbi:hypothetical protein [Streptomyces sp. NRRL F-2664]|uniref:hypothetical protein n=1 Tax=Streptomyces sp. NRRL F-2664 TaxID=1463842 RepID=UPI0004CA7F47|nr:hypothetical protein [Streptomyces sp. NRRL F-2664]
MADVLPVDTDSLPIARLDASTPQAAADAWNAANPVGSWVVAYPWVRPKHPAFDPKTVLITRTRSKAWPLGHGALVVLVEGYSGGIVLEHVDVVTAERAGLLAEQHHQLDDPAVPDFHFYTRTGGQS